jgi:hypothetical protein
LREPESKIEGSNATPSTQKENSSGKSMTNMKKLTSWPIFATLRRQPGANSRHDVLPWISYVTQVTDELPRNNLREWSSFAM